MKKKKNHAWSQKNHSFYNGSKNSLDRSQEQEDEKYYSRVDEGKIYTKLNCSSTPKSDNFTSLKI